MIKSDFPYIQVVHGKIYFHDGDLISLPKEYQKNIEKTEKFYKAILDKGSEKIVIGLDPIGFNYIYLQNFCNIGLVIGSGSGLSRDNGKKYPVNKFSKEFLIKRIEKERKLMSFEDFIPREFVTQNIHELRNLNSKVSSNIDALLNIREEDEWDEKFDKADENVKKIFVASRLIKFILDNIKFYIPDYIQGIELDITRSFRIHRSASKIVKIYRNDFKKKKSEIELLGNTNRVLFGDREYFEIILMLLIENALKYSNDSASLAPQVELEDIGKSTRLTIKSYGLIIPKDDQGKLFSKGFRSAVHRGINEGTGMGLHNASELVRLFNGRLNYTSEKVNVIQEQDIGWNCFQIDV
jgi:signal transduction histidine kinase